MIQKHISLLRLLSVVMGGVLPLSPATATPVLQPIVVELFTSQGCSSCPPANETLIKLADRPDVLALSFGVTYWDDLGWKDTFASPAYTQRQWDYAHGLHHDNVGTPQIVVDGRADTIGQAVSQVDPLIKAARAVRGNGPDIIIRAHDVSFAASAPHAPASVWLVWYDPRIVQVPVRRGENNGRTLPHRNVVHGLVKLGVWSGKAEQFALPAAHDINTKPAILIQAGTGGPIIAAATD